MRVAIEMPKLNYGMETGVVQAWRKGVGDPVQQGEIVADIEAEKATVELESPVTGTLVDIVHAPGDEVDVRTPIAWIDADG
jgi:pyruvate/2-oxoglutarate dehydrogenase complex dihydrolipoamide acyltransferase (E2) component